MADANAEIKVNINTSDALSSLKILQAQISAFQQQMARSGAAAAQAATNMQQNLINNINATGQFSATLKNIQTDTEAFTTSLEKNKLSLGQYFKYAGGASKSFGKMFRTEFDTINKVAVERVKDLQTQYIQLGRDANGAMKSIAVRPLQLDMENLGTKTQIAAQKQQLLNQLLKQGSTNLLNFGKNTQWAGRQLMVGFTIPLTMLGSTAAKTFMDMEEQVIKFKRVYGDLGTTIQETNAMSKEIQNLASQFTQYGVAVKDTMALAAQAAASGKTGSDLTAQVTEATRLAVLGQVEQQQALETTISLTNAFGISADQLKGKINFLNAVENQTVTSIEDLTVAIPKAGPVIEQLGGNVEDLTFFLTAMKEGGINASEGANALKSGLAAIINPTKTASDMLAGFGINIKQLVDSNKGDVKGLIMGLATALNKLDPTNRARAIEQMFGKFQFARISTLFKNVVAEGSQANRVLELTQSSSMQLATLASQELDKVSKSPMYRFKKAIEDIKTSLMPVGEEFLKIATPVIEFGTKLLDSFNKLDSGTKQFITGFTTVVAGIGPVLLMTFGLIANGVANVIKGFTFVKNVFNRAGSASTVLGEQVSYMTQEQLNAAAVAASLEQSHNNLTQAFNVEAGAVANLRVQYERTTAAQMAFSGMNNIPRPGSRKFATGGMVTGPGTGTSDSIPAMVSNGEFIVSAKRTKQYLPLLQNIAQGKVPGFASKDTGGSLVGKNKRKAPTTFSVSGGSYEDKAFSISALFGPGNTVSGFGIDRDWLKNSPEAGASWNASMLSGTASSMKSRMSADKLVDTVLPKFQSVFDDLLETYRAGVDSAKDVVDLGKSTYPTMKKQLEEAVASGKITLREAAHINSSLRRLVNPRNSDYTESIAAPRYEGAFVDGQPFLKRAGVTERKGKSLKNRTQKILGKIRTNMGMDPKPVTHSWSHLSESSSRGTTFQEPRIRTAKSLADMQIAVALKESLAQGQSVGQGPLSIDTSGMARSQAAKNAGKKSGKDSIEDFNDGLVFAAQTASPSKRTKKIAGDIVDGVEVGLKEGIDDVRVVGENLADSLVTGASKKRGGTGRGLSRQGTVGPNGKLIPMLNLQSGYELAPTSSNNFIGPRLPTRKEKLQQKLVNFKTGYNNLKTGKTQLGGFKVAAGLGTASMVAGIAGMSGVPGMGELSGILGVISMFGGVISKIVPVLLRFAGPIGLAITAIGGLVTAVNLVNDAKKKELKEISALGNASILTKNQLTNLGNIFGVSATENAFSLAASGATTNKVVKQRSDIETLKASESFQNDYKDTIESLKTSTNTEASVILKSLAIQLQGSGFAKEQIDTIITAIKEQAKKTNLVIDLNKIDINTKSGQSSLRKTTKSLVNQLNKEINKKDAITIEKIPGMVEGPVNPNTGLPTQKIGTIDKEIFSKELKTKIDQISKSMVSNLGFITSGLQNGQVSVKSYKASINALKSSVLSLGENSKATKVLLAGMIQNSGMNKSAQALANSIKDVSTQMLVLQGYALGLTKFQFVADAQAVLSDPKATADAKERAAADIAKYKRAIDRQIKAAADLASAETTTPDTPNASDLTAQESARIKALEAKLKALNKERDALKEINAELDRKQQFEIAAEQRAIDAKQAMLSGNYLKAALLKEENAQAQVKFDRETKMLELEKQISAIENSIQTIKDAASNRTTTVTKKATGGLIKGPGTGTSDSILGTLKFALGGLAPIRVSSGEYITRAASVAKYGVNFMNSINDGSYNPGTTSGGSVYNINMTVNGGNASASEIADMVMKKFNTIQAKNNTSNKVMF